MNQLIARRFIMPNLNRIDTQYKREGIKIKGKNTSQLFLVFTAFTIFFASHALATPLFLPATGEIKLLATGLDANLQANPDNSPLLLTFEAGITLSEQKSVTSYGAGFTPNGINTAAAFKSAASVKALNGSLGLRLEGSGQGGWASSPKGGGEATVTWTDSLSLVQKNTGQISILPSSSLLLNYRLEGALTTSINNTTGFSSSIDSTASVRASVLSESVSFSVNKNAVFNPLGKDITFFPKLSGEAVLNSSREVDFSVSLGITTSASWGHGVADFGNSLSFDSITFLDGSTPESHGFDIVFASGIQSPNLVNNPPPDPIPEPSTMFLFGTGIAVLVGVSRSKKK